MLASLIKIPRPRITGCAQVGLLATVVSALDNLVKGASGQAVQNMNLVLDYPEDMGLEQIALFP